jgi:hypothetical protein
MAKQKDANGGKNACPLTRQRFRAAAKPLTLTIDGKTLVAAPKEFSTGSFGWFCNDKLVIEVDGVPVKVQPSISLVIVGSKDAG